MLKREEAIETLKEVIEELEDYQYLHRAGLVGHCPLLQGKDLKKIKKVKEVIEFLES